MPVKTAKKTIKAARKIIRKHWSDAETARCNAANWPKQMQQRLVEALGLKSAHGATVIGGCCTAGKKSLGRGSRGWRRTTRPG